MNICNTKYPDKVSSTSTPLSHPRWGLDSSKSLGSCLDSSNKILLATGESELEYVALLKLKFLRLNSPARANEAEAFYCCLTRESCLPKFNLLSGIHLKKGAEMTLGVFFIVVLNIWREFLVCIVAKRL